MKFRFRMFMPDGKNFFRDNVEVLGKTNLQVEDLGLQIIQEGQKLTLWIMEKAGDKQVRSNLYATVKPEIRKLITATGKDFDTNKFVKGLTVTVFMLEA